MKGKNKKRMVFKGWPKVTRLTNKPKGLTGYRIRGGYLTPGRAKNIDLVVMLFLFVAGIETAAVMLGQTWTNTYIVAGAFAVFALVTFYGFRWLVSKLIFIEIWPDVIRVAKRFRFDEYDRTLQHQFDLVEHDQALDEQMQVQRNNNMRRYYMNSAWVILRHPSGSLHMAAVYPRKKAERLLERLQSVEMAGQFEQEGTEDCASGAPHTGRRPDPA